MIRSRLDQLIESRVGEYASIDQMKRVEQVMCPGRDATQACAVIHQCCSIDF